MSANNAENVKDQPLMHKHSKIQWECFGAAPSEAYKRMVIKNRSMVMFGYVRKNSKSDVPNDIVELITRLLFLPGGECFTTDGKYHWGIPVQPACNSVKLYLTNSMNNREFTSVRYDASSLGLKVSKVITYIDVKITVETKLTRKTAVVVCKFVGPELTYETYPARVEANLDEHFMVRPN